MTDKSENVIDYAEMGDAAAAGEDQQQMKEGGGGFDRPTPKAGSCMLRLRQYIEVGVQPSKNPKYKPAQKVILSFEINSPKHMIELDDGTKIPNGLVIHLNKGGKTSQYGKLFTALNYSGKYNHFAQMVGVVGWMGTITHNVVDAGKDTEKTYANLYEKATGWGIGAPLFENPATGEITPLAVPDLSGDPMVFMYENSGLTDAQYLALWESIEIEGTHDSGKNEGKSKNWIQDLITSSLKFPDSRLCNLLGGAVTAQDVGALEDLPIDTVDSALDSGLVSETTEEEILKETAAKLVDKKKTAAKVKKDAKAAKAAEKATQAAEALAKVEAEKVLEEEVEEVDPLVAAGLV